ncbi:hypothetical protein PMKS-002199 [Pichia membranifaciens]|uniref:Tag1-like fifth Ig-like domain-containing protein n=1 Tax=Pichia membranifaciens TaxID=4926 RepID=A0A1Q2YGR2_9ASCO|nr:hypothetical protein PMKS-002199 [Pichia membranifaciens]
MTNPDQMNDNHKSLDDEYDETVGLLIAQPVPVRYNSIPSLIRDSEDVIVDEQPSEFYSRWRLKFYILAGIIMAFLLLVIGSILDLKYVLKSIEVDIGGIEVLESNFSGILVNIQNVDVDFQNAGIFNWIEKLNLTEIEFVNDTMVYDEHYQLIFEINTLHKNLSFNVHEESTHHWFFDFDEVFVNIEGDRLSKTINQLSTNKTSVFHISSKVKVAGKTFSVRKTMKFEKNNLDGFLDRILLTLMKGISVQNIQIRNYNPEIGFEGIGDAVLKIDSIKNLRIPRIGSSIGFMVGDNLYKVADVIFTNFASIENEHFVVFKFTLFNVEEIIIKDGRIDDVLWRLLNDDSKKDKLQFTIVGTEVDDDGWIRDMWEELVLDVGIRLHNIFDSSFDSCESTLSDFWNIDVTDFNLGLDKSSGQLTFDAHLLYFHDILMQNFKANIEGNILADGINVIFENFTVNKIDTLFIGASIQDSSVNIVDVNKSKKIVQNFLNKDAYSQYVPIEIASRIDLASDFFKGPININGTFIVCLGKLASLSIYNFFKTSNGFIELVDMKYIEGGSGYAKIGIDSKLRLPPFMNTLDNEIETINTAVNYDAEEVSELSMMAFKSEDGVIPLGFEVTLNSGDDDKKRKVEEFVGEVISGVTTNVTLHGISTENQSSIFGCNKNICELYDSISIPLSLSSKDITSGEGGKNYFIRDTIMHVISKEVEMTLFNPISNRNLILEIEEGEAICEGYIIGYLKEKIVWEVESGIWKSPRAKVEYANTGSAGWKIIENAIKGDGKINNMTVRAVVKVYISGDTEWSGLNIMYQSTGQTNGKVRW